MWYVITACVLNETYVCFDRGLKPSINIIMLSACYYIALAFELLAMIWL